MQSARITRAMLSLQENTADRSPPFSPPEGTAITSLSSPARFRERWAFSFPAHSSMQPKGRMAVTVQSNCSGLIFFTFILNSMPEGHPWVHFEREQRRPALADSHFIVSGKDDGRASRAGSKNLTFPRSCRMML